VKDPMEDRLSALAAALAADVALRLDPADPRARPADYVLAGVPRAHRETFDIVSIHLPRGVSLAQARAAGSAVRAVFVGPGPWVPLRELPPGALFELKTGDRGVIRAEPARSDSRVRVVYFTKGEDADPLGSVLARRIDLQPYAQES